MARLLRYEAAGPVYRAMARGAGGRNVFTVTGPVHTDFLRFKCEFRDAADGIGSSAKNHGQSPLGRVPPGRGPEFTVYRALEEASLNFGPRSVDPLRKQVSAICLGSEFHTERDAPGTVCGEDAAATFHGEYQIFNRGWRGWSRMKSFESGSVGDFQNGNLAGWSKPIISVFLIRAHPRHPRLKDLSYDD